MNKGFTLVELLVVIAIIGLLASVTLASLESVRAKARDARRLADLRQMVVALNLFYDDNGRYPTEGAPDNANGSIAPGNSGGINTILANYMGETPMDPIHGTGYYYYYDGAQLCGGEPDLVPVIAIRRLEVLPSNRTELCNGSWGGEGGIGAEGLVRIWNV